MQEHHPIGLIPTIVDDGFQLFESRAICEYLLAKYGRDHELYRHGRDETPESIGQFSQAISMEYSYFQPTIFGLAFEFMFKQ